MDLQAKTCFIGGKAAAGYYVAKRIIALATAVGRVINNDPDTKDFLKLIFIPNYKVCCCGVPSRY